MIDLSRIGIRSPSIPKRASWNSATRLSLTGAGARACGTTRRVADPEVLDDVADRPAHTCSIVGCITPDDAERDRAGLRYDLTVTLPGEVGGELAKTAGHIHNSRA